uniref:Dynein regulatory complex protein 9 n=1 Tax=Chlamydomonas reinhardtii TaxID=3055 RepID=DRC9_CHLRE|nr:RecName: Full=Dynein regulatory complex protein 9; AltName: Full=Flagellar associated protein 122 [Chlamydomonas reinhardtii]|eukprot:XP_001689998.1 flagellar associated protein [Chlamydomonas reinhardtii]
MVGIDTGGKIPPEIMRQATEKTAQLAPLEGGHIYSILKQTLEKLALVGQLQVDPKVQAHELTQSVGEEISRMITEQKKLESRFEELVALQHVLRHQPNKTKLMENQVASERQALQLLLSNCLNEIEVFGKVQPLVESVMAQQAAEQAMKETIEREKNTTAAVRQLRNDLREEKLDHEEKMKEKKKGLSTLKEQLKALKMDTAVSTRYLSKDLTAGNEHERRLQRTQLEDLLKDLGLVQQQIDIEKAVHATQAEFLRQIAAKMADDSSNWASRHDGDLAAREKELEMLKQQHARDLIELKKAEEKFKMEQALKKEREMKATEERERAEFEEMRETRRAQAAVIIQAWWRGHKVRMVMSGGGKKGAKKGGAKKKK